MRRRQPRASRLSTTGSESCTNVRKRLLMVSALSSERPEESPRLSRRASISASLTSRKSMKAGEPTALSNASRLEMERGKPSIRNGPARPAIAFVRRRTVVSDLTICPWLMTFEISSPSSDPERTSSRSNSPAERCTSPNRSTRRSHCVPLPLPGPPMMKYTLGGASTAVSSSAARRCCSLSSPACIAQLTRGMRELARSITASSLSWRIDCGARTSAGAVPGSSSPRVTQSRGGGRAIVLWGGPRDPQGGAEITRF